MQRQLSNVHWFDINGAFACVTTPIKSHFHMLICLIVTFYICDAVSARKVHKSKVKTSITGNYCPMVVFCIIKMPHATSLLLCRVENGETLGRVT